MKNLTIDDLISVVEEYNLDEVEVVKKAYFYADSLHKGQFRQSGEAYIMHPLNVAYTLAIMHADRDTVCAGLLHDTLEDTKITKEEIAEIFNREVANLVDGVTKISKLNFSTKQEQNMANTRKIITSITNDVRIIIIKLADRLHNMQTLQYKSEFKQKENSLETMEIYVPIAYYIGAYQIKNELEDLSLKYLYPDKYRKIEEIKGKIKENNEDILIEMLESINNIMSDRNIPHHIKIRIKNIYGIYKKMEKGFNIDDIHDLLALKIIVNNIEECYQTLGIVHSKYHPINSKFKDYIFNPKTNMYQSLHTTVFGPGSRLVQTQIKTGEMDKIAEFGLTGYWDVNKEVARYKMQADLKDKCQFFESLVEINKSFGDNKEFVTQVKAELFSDKIYVYTPKGDVIELPKGATPIDFAYKIRSDLANNIAAIIVNDQEVSPNTQLKNKDRIRIIKNNFELGPKEEWLSSVKTSKAKRKIKEYKKNMEVK